jgi:hypothetical protein
MPTATYTPLANITLAASAGSISFGSIPSSYSDLVVVVQAKSAGTAQDLRVTLNSITTTSYRHQRMDSNGSTAGAGETSSNRFQFPVAQVGVTDGHSAILNFLDYATNKNKVILARSNNGDIGTSAIAGELATTAAVTSIQISLPTSNLAAGSTFALYGIVA